MYIFKALLFTNHCICIDPKYAYWPAFLQESTICMIFLIGKFRATAWKICVFHSANYLAATPPWLLLGFDLLTRLSLFLCQILMHLVYRLPHVIGVTFPLLLPIFEGFLGHPTGQLKSIFDFHYWATSQQIESSLWIDYESLFACLLAPHLDNLPSQYCTTEFPFVPKYDFMSGPDCLESTSSSKWIFCSFV